MYVWTPPLRCCGGLKSICALIVSHIRQDMKCAANCCSNCIVNWLRNDCAIIHTNIYLFAHARIRISHMCLYVCMCVTNCKLYMPTMANGVLHNCWTTHTHLHTRGTSSRRWTVCEWLPLTVIMQLECCNNPFKFQLWCA